MKSLHAAGHNITFISPFPSKNQIENYTMVDSKFNNSFIYMSNTFVNEYAGISLSDLLLFSIQMDEELCYNLMKLEVIQVTWNTFKQIRVAYPFIVSLFD